MPPAQDRCDHCRGQCDHCHGARTNLHHRCCCDGQRRRRNQGGESQQRQSQSQRPPWRFLAGRLQQRQASGRRLAKASQGTRRRRHARAERRAEYQRLHDGSRHDQQTDLLERRREAQSKCLADRLESHVGRDAIDHDRGHDGEEDGKVDTLDQQHDRQDGDRHEKGGKKHGGGDLSAANKLVTPGRLPGMTLGDIVFAPCASSLPFF